MIDDGRDRGSPGGHPGTDLGEHPRGTLFIVGLMGLLYGIGWVVLYWIFLARGGIHP